MTKDQGSAEAEMRRPRLTREAIPVLLLAAAFFLRGAFLNLSLPYGDPLDEIFHYAYASYLAQELHPPRAGEDSIEPDVFRPHSFLPRSSFLPGPRVSFEEFARLTEDERSRRRQLAFRFLPGERGVFVTPNYESQQPPLAYGAVLGLLKVLPRAPLHERLLAIRLAASLLASAAVPLAYAFFRRLLDRRAALAATVAFVAFPGLGSFVGRFANDALALPIVTALLILFADVPRGRLSWARAVAITLLLAAGCWTKPYLLLLLPAAPLLALLCRGRDRPIVRRRAFLAASLAFLLFFPWLLRQHADTGDWFGFTPSKQASQLELGLLDRVRAAPSLFTARFMIVFGRTFLWPGTWSAAGAPPAASVLLVLALGILLVWPWIRGTVRSARRSRTWLAGGLAVALFLIGHLVYAATYAAIGSFRGHAPSAGPDGWYHLVLLPVILSAGCALGQKVPAGLFLGAGTLFAAVEWWVTFGVLPAVYAGATGFNGANTPFGAYSRFLLSPRAALDVYEKVGLTGVSSAGLLLILWLWLAALASAVAYGMFRPIRGSAQSKP